MISCYTGKIAGNLFHRSPAILIQKGFCSTKEKNTDDLYRRLQEEIIQKQDQIQKLETQNIKFNVANTLFHTTAFAALVYSKDMGYVSYGDVFLPTLLIGSSYGACASHIDRPTHFLQNQIADLKKTQDELKKEPATKTKDVINT